MKDKKLYSDFALLLTKKLELFEVLIKLSNKQVVIINNENWDDLQSLLDKKEEIMQEVDELQDRLDPIIELIIRNYGLDRSNWAEGLQEIAGISSDIKDSLKHLGTCLKELRELNDKNVAKMNEKRMALNEDMMKLQDGRKANKGYNNTQRIYSTFIDRKS